jgi:hypothetical protein
MTLKSSSRASGQAVVEMVFIIPLFLLLAAGCGAVVYMCFQGLKVQQAANVAARIHGQERVAGGPSTSAIRQDNGLDGARPGDVDPSLVLDEEFTKDKSADELRQLTFAKKNPQFATSVYGRVKKTVRSFFGSDEQQDLYIPAPNAGIVGYSDNVKVVRVIKFPAIFGLDIKPIVITADAYGGEDTRMWGLVRWGRKTQNETPDKAFWKTTINPTRD